MTFCVYRKFLQHKIWIFSFCYKSAVLAKKCRLINLQFKEFNHLVYLIENSSFNGNILDHIHLNSDLFFSSTIFDKTNSGTWEESLWIFTK